MNSIRCVRQSAVKLAIDIDSLLTILVRKQIEFLFSFYLKKENSIQWGLQWPRAIKKLAVSFLVSLQFHSPFLSLSL